MSLFYRLAYAVGFRPWEHAAEHPAAAGHIHAILDREGERRGGVRGRALDIGCGSGAWLVELARRGWAVSGIDNVGTAVQEARARVERAGVRAEIVQGDVAALRRSGIDGPFHLFWDFGAIHAFPDAQRSAAGAEIDAVAAPGAALLILVWAPGRRGPLPRGMSRVAVQQMLPRWAITDEEPFDATGLPRPLRGVAPCMYRLEKPGASGVGPA